MPRLAAAAFIEKLESGPYGHGDYDGDGKADVLWRHARLGEVWMWLMEGRTITSSTWIATIEPGYEIQDK